MKRPKLGAHVSVAGKLANGIVRAQTIGAECIQIFGASPRGWAVRGHTSENIAEFKKVREAAGIGPVFLHGAYLVNLATSDHSLCQKSEVNLAEHLKIAEAIGAEGLIFHIGSGKEPDTKGTEKTVAEAMKRILRYVTGRAWLVIENSAGGGSKIGAEPEEIGRIIDMIGSKRVKVCWDTQHGFASGITERYDAHGVSALFDRMERSFGLENLVAFHVNDSKTEANSRHDRHENLGSGKIGLSGFKKFAAEPRSHRAAWILEVPGFDDMGPDKKNVDILKSLFV